MVKSSDIFHSQNVEATMAKRGVIRRSLPRAMSLTGSVIPKAFLPSFFCTLVAFVVTYLYENTSIKLSIQPQFITVVGFVLSLLLAYRTNTAYDRYWEGRRLWGSLVITIRNMTRLIWVNVRQQKVADDKKKKQKTASEILVEKRTVINLLVGFAVATKYFLRREPPKKDLLDLIPGIESSIPRYEVGDVKDEQTTHLQFHRKRNTAETDYNLPLELTLYLSAYVNTCLDDGILDGPTQTQLLNGVASLTDSLTSFERVLHTPIPWAYAVHLDQTVWIYCLTLSFQLVSTLHWVTIPVVFFASLVLIGVLKIGEEIENPFGYDPNDLDLTGFCDLLEEELHGMTAHPPPNITYWVFSKDNHPFGRGGITAAEARDLTVDEIHERLSISKEADDGEDIHTTVHTETSTEKSEFLQVKVESNK